MLNSLAGDFIPESLRLLRRGGRFVEIGKTGIWDAARVAQEFPGVAYHPLYLGEVAARATAVRAGHAARLLVDVDAGLLSPLPHRAYPIERAEDAFRFMGQGQHTGKIVITPASGSAAAIGCELSRDRWPRRPRSVLRPLAGRRRCAPSGAGRTARARCAGGGSDCRAPRATEST